MTKKKKEDKSTVADKTSENVAEQQEAASQVEQEVAEEVEEEVELSEVDKLTADLAESKDKYLRLYSEFDNYRRRTAKERLDLMQTAGEGILSELIPVLDDFERAVKSADSKDEKSVLEGLTLISQKFEKTLQNQGLKAMETPVGTAFDPDIHEAITQIPASKKKLKGKIVDTIEKGYYLGEKVIRFAKVVTGS
ncbi:MAG: nucleotide exchange factor GrpE [Cyclobacteriaceae bacterium]|nr:nucleotide exchange factor GrpE [Cyclobacteriaceae bacterium]